MSKKLITICDSCQKPIIGEDNIFHIKILSNAQLKDIWGEGGWMPFDFCKTCSRNIRKSLAIIGKNLDKGGKK